jgi:hypothetical protein
MIDSVRIEGFRCFQMLEVAGFSRINVIVGANNTGKSALLEAVEFLVADGGPARLWSLLARRGQLYEGASLALYGDATELGFGRKPLLEGSTQFSLADSSGRSVVVKAERGTAGPLLAVVRPQAARGYVLPLAAGKGIAQSDIERSGEPDAGAVVRVGSQLTSPEVLRTGWAPLAGNPGEELVAECLRCIDPTIDRVTYAPQGTKAVGYEGWFVRRRNSEVREAVSGQGEGLKRALALSLALANCRNGTLLVDEVENGLHFTVIPLMWRFLHEAARTLNAQLFLTSHSRDLIEGFAEAQRRAGAEFDDVAFFRIEASRSKVVRISHRVAAHLPESGQDFR